MKKEQIKSYLSLVVAAMLSQVVACSPPNDAHESNHAGVLTETESGHTVAFTLHSYVDEYNPKQSAKVNFALTKIVDGKTKLLDSATVKYGDYAVFEDITGAYSVVATATGLNGEKDTLYGVDVLKRNDVDTVYVRVQEPATLKISTSYTETVKSSHGEETQEIFSEGSTLCITGTLTCKKISKDDIKHGYAIVKNIPLFDNEEYVKQIEIQSGKELRTLGVEWNFSAGDTLYASESVIAEKRWLDFDFELPESDMYDTIGGAVIDSLIVPVKIADDDFYHYNWKADFFLDQLGNVISTSSKKKDLLNDTTLYWIVVPKMDPTAKLTLASGELKDSYTYNRLRAYWPEVEKDTLWRWIEVFEDSSFAISFWLELDSLADSTVLLGNCDSLGFEIRRCQKDSSAICTRIYNGIDTASTDSIEYGKASILDGKRHHYSLAIHKKHLTIAVDGVTIRDTDLKLSEKFYNVEGIRATPGLAHEILLYSFGDFIRYPGDRSWTRLKAWLYAFYEFQKDIF